MSVDFSKITGLSDSYGAITQITDASGRVIWAVKSGDKVILEVEKITCGTYAGETTYTAEEFILLDIYPKTNGTVKVTYGGLTKTITDTSGAEEPNAQQVFFGTFNGVSDEVETPASGTLTIEGDYYAFGNGSFSASKLFSGYAGSIVKVLNFGKISVLPAGAFSCNLSGFTNNFEMLSVSIPNGVTRIEDEAFNACESLRSVTIPDSVTSIGAAFFGCANLESIVVNSGNGHYYAKDGILFNHSKTEIVCAARASVNGAYIIPSGVTTIGEKAFYSNNNLISVTIPESVTCICKQAFLYCANLGSVTFAMVGTNTKFWRVINDSEITGGVVVEQLNVGDPATNAYRIRSNGDDQYGNHKWIVVSTG